MLFVIHGATATERKNAVKEILQKKYSHQALQFHVIETSPSFSELQTKAYQSKSFFDELQIVLLKDITPLLVVEHGTKLWNMFSQSETIFFLLDESHTQSVLSELQQTSAEIVALKKRSEKNRHSINYFAICDAFSKKNKFRVWHELLCASSVDEKAEAVIGRLYSRIRTMLLEKQYAPYTKEQIERLSASLALLLPQARQKGKDAMLALESWVLKLPE